MRCGGTPKSVPSEIFWKDMYSNNNSNRVGDYLSPAAKDFIAGTVSGFAGKIVEHPFDTVKVLLQTQQKPQSSHKNVKSVSSAVSTATQFRPPLGVCLERCQLTEKHSVSCFACSWLYGILALHSAYVPNERFLAFTKVCPVPCSVRCLS